VKPLWCWRCKREVPMLDEEEYRRVYSLFNTGVGNSLERLWGPLRREYERITGLPAVHRGDIVHHRLALYGPPCKACGKPLRSQRAKLCGACMAPVTADEPTGPSDPPKDA
jgi:hypothetical protein